MLVLSVQTAPTRPHCTPREPRRLIVTSRHGAALSLHGVGRNPPVGLPLHFRNAPGQGLWGTGEGRGTEGGGTREDGKSRAATLGAQGVQSQYTSTATRSFTLRTHTLCAHTHTHQCTRTPTQQSQSTINQTPHTPSTCTCTHLHVLTVFTALLQALGI